MEGGAAFNSINFGFDHNDLGGANFTACTTVFQVFLCPSASRDTGTGRDEIDPSDAMSQLFKVGYGVQDYGATPYTDIDPLGRTGMAGSSKSAPYRNKASRVDGMLRQTMTRHSEVTDGVSNTALIVEDAGRDARFQSPYLEQDMIGSSPRSDPYIVKFSPPRNVPVGQRRFWRWADADGSFGVSTRPNNTKFGDSTCPARTDRPYMAPDITIEGNNCGNNDEAFSFHPGGVNSLMGDGSVRFIKESINLVVWRGVITRGGGEVISSDSF